MRFKNKEDYQTQRTNLMNEIEQLMNDGKNDEALSKMETVEKMDEDWMKDAIELANKSALEGKFASLVKIGEGEKIVNTSIVKPGEENKINDFTDSIEYRNAFMNYVITGKSIPSEFKNVDANTKTTDVGVLIPNTTVNRIIEKMEKVGQIYSRVTRTSFKGGVTIPTSTVKPVATWVSEGSTSDKQKKTLGSITFAYHKLRCAISMSLETYTMALPIFETMFVNNVAEAMVKAIEESIVNGTGSGQPKGILKETATKNISVAKTGKFDLSTLEAAEAALPLAYEAGAVWVMNKATYLEAKLTKDQTGDLIFKEVRGVDGNVQRYLFERQVVLTDILPSINSTLSSPTVVAFLFKLDDYILNENYNMGIREYYDEETEDKIKKSVMLLDGKTVDANSLVTITKANA